MQMTVHTRSPSPKFRKKRADPIPQTLVQVFAAELYPLTFVNNIYITCAE